MRSSQQLEIAWSSERGIESTSPPPSQAHSRTSVEAAKRQRRLRLSGDRLRILAWIAERGDLGATNEEGQAALGLEGDTYRPRRIELARYGWLTEKGERLVASGKAAAVWVLSASGAKALAAARALEQGQE